MKPKKNDHKPFIVMSILIILAVIYLSLHMGAALKPDNTIISSTFPQIKTESSYDYTQAFLTALDTMASDPLAAFPPTAQSFQIMAVLLFLAGAFLAIMYLKEEKRKEIMTKNTNGSAKWNTDYKKYNKCFTTPWEDKSMPDPNILLSKDLKLGMYGLALDYQRNLNNAIVGGSGTGKTYRVIKPNIAQANCSYVVTDPSGDIMKCLAKLLIKKGYVVKIFSTSDMLHSNRYNPFDYVYDTDGSVDDTKVNTLIYLFLRNAKESKQKSGDPFWEKSAKALLTAIAYYMLENEGMQKEDVNFTTMLKMVQAGKVDETNSSTQSMLDRLMEEERRMAAENGRISKAVSNFSTFKLAPSKTANSILITCAVDLQIFESKAVRNMTRTDTEDDIGNVHLEKIGDQPTALFINIPQANGTYNFLVAMLYSQLFDTCYTKGDHLMANVYQIDDKKGRPLFSMLKDKKTADNILENNKRIKIKENRNQHGGIYYEIIYGKTVLRECMDKDAAEKILADTEGAVVKKSKNTTMTWHIRCLMDEFANIGEVPEFPKILATCRRYNISVSFVLQNIAQLKSMYKDEWEGILGNADTKIFLGSSENETCKYFSELLGKCTVIVRNNSESASAKGKNASRSFNHIGRELMTSAELAQMDNTMSVVYIRGIDPFYTEKYDFKKHPNYSLTGDCDKANETDREFMDLYYTAAPVAKSSVKRRRKQQEARILHVDSQEIQSAKELQESLGAGSSKELSEKMEKPTAMAEELPFDIGLDDKKEKEPKKNKANLKMSDASETFQFESF